jgi:FtsP/CotA-like multicopper oxidase with cupredoxin domain
MKTSHWRESCAWLILAFMVTVTWPDSAGAAAASAATVEANDNLRAAGQVGGKILRLDLRAGTGRWQPEGPAGPTLEIEALGEVGKALTVPAPLIRVVEGTEIAASVRNDLSVPLTIHGLCTRGTATCSRLEVPPQQTREVRFASGPPGTYHYWASTLGAPIPFRELAGAFVVDDADRPIEPDRILVITEWTDLTLPQLRKILAADVASEAFVTLRPRVTFVINGLSWPATERLSYEVGERVRWRVINLSSQPHPLHLHGFYFDVDALGDGARETRFRDVDRRRVVTQLLASGQTMMMTWTPERVGNWLFHCHVMHHVSVERRIGSDPSGEPSAAAGAHSHHHTGDASAGMAGMVIGLIVREARSTIPTPRPDDVASPPRKLTLVMQRATGGSSDVPASGFVLREGDDVSPAPETPSTPGPAIVLQRNRPVEITLVNQLGEATAIHWHGIELDSYYDGVHHWSGVGQRVTPMIDPGGKFIVHFTPPRAGTFIYHTHLHDYRQLSSGMYGPLVVVDPDEVFDPQADHVIVLGRSGISSHEPSTLTEPESVVINGQHRPRLVWKAGTRHRLRLINITPDDLFSVSLQSPDGPITWRPVAKDGARLPEAHTAVVGAHQMIAVGETYDFEYEAPPGRKTLWLEVRTPGGKWQAQGHIVIK